MFNNITNSISQQRLRDGEMQEEKNQENQSLKYQGVQIQEESEEYYSKTSKSIEDASDEKANLQHNMMLRNVLKRKRVKRNNRRLLCHYCRSEFNPPCGLTCTNYSDCQRRFCNTCLKRYFPSELRNEKLYDVEFGWVCMVCRGQCHCRRCQRKIKNELEAIDEIDSQPVPKLSPEVFASPEAVFEVHEWRPKAFLKNEEEFNGPRSYISYSEGVKRNYQETQKKKRISSYVKKMSSKISSKEVCTSKKEDNREGKSKVHRKLGHRATIGCRRRNPEADPTPTANLKSRVGGSCSDAHLNRPDSLQKLSETACDFSFPTTTWEYRMLPPP